MKRPIIISVLCIFGFLYVFFTPLMFLVPVPIQSGKWWHPFVGCTAILTLICTIGLWRMRKWGLFGYVITLILFQYVSFELSQWDMWTLLPLFVVILVG